MTSALDNRANDESQECDLWAIQVVVREGARMNLSREEQILAAHLMRAKGFDGRETATRLRISHDLVHKFWGLKPPMPVEDVPTEVIGPLVKKPLVTRADCYRMTGS